MKRDKKRSDRSKPLGPVAARQSASREASKVLSASRMIAEDERLNQLADVARHWIWEVNAKGLYTYSNSAVKEILGYDPSEIVGKKYFYDFFLDHSRDRIKRTVFEAFECRARIVDFVNSCVHKNGNIIHLLTNGIPIVGKDGQLSGYRGVDVDITTRQKAEEELRRANEQLAETLTRLKKVQEQVVQHERLGALWQMADGITHKFNNALTPIIGHSDLLVSRPEMLDDRDEAITMLNEIRKAGLQARDAVRQLHEFCRASDDTVFESVDLTDLIDDAIKLSQSRWKGEFEARGVGIEFRKDFADLPPVRGVRSQLSEVFINLILNATDAMPEGGAITISASPDESGRVLTIEVSDTGTGMPEDVRRRAMEPFFTTRGFQRSGLGLSVVHGIMRRHKGHIDIQSSSGAGTTVIVRLPVFMEPAATKAEQSSPENGALAKKSLRILFIDDEQPVRDLIARYLAIENHVVELAANGIHGVQRFKEEKHDLVITDWAMPDMNGDKVAAAIKETDRRTPVILLTGFGDSFNRTAKLPPGVDLVLSKPVTRSAFSEAIAQVMNK